MNSQTIKPMEADFIPPERRIPFPILFTECWPTVHWRQNKVLMYVIRELYLKPDCLSMLVPNSIIFDGETDGMKNITRERKMFSDLEKLSISITNNLKKYLPENYSSRFKSGVINICSSAFLTHEDDVYVTITNEFRDVVRHSLKKVIGDSNFIFKAEDNLSTRLYWLISSWQIESNSMTIRTEEFISLMSLSDGYLKRLRDISNKVLPRLRDRLKDTTANFDYTVMERGHRHIRLEFKSNSQLMEGHIVPEQEFEPFLRSIDVNDNQILTLRKGLIDNKVNREWLYFCIDYTYNFFLNRKIRIGNSNDNPAGYFMSLLRSDSDSSSKLSFIKKTFDERDTSVACNLPSKPIPTAELIGKSAVTPGTRSLSSIINQCALASELSTWYLELVIKKKNESRESEALSSMPINLRIEYIKRYIADEIRAKPAYSKYLLSKFPSLTSVNTLFEDDDLLFSIIQSFAIYKFDWPNEQLQAVGELLLDLEENSMP